MEYRITSSFENITKSIFHYSPWFHTEKGKKQTVIKSIEDKLTLKIKFQEIKLSSLIKKVDLPSFAKDEWIFIIDDLKWKEWEKYANHLVSNYFIPFFYGKNPILFLSSHINKFDKTIVIHPDNVHASWGIAASDLAIEQMSFLIKAKGIFIAGDYQYYYDWIDELLLKWNGKNGSESSLKCDNGILKIKHPKIKEGFCVSNFQLGDKKSEYEYSYSDFYNNSQGNRAIPKTENIDVKSSLDQFQYRAVVTANAPVQVLAPAGSGKTRTLIYRIIYLIQNGVAPERILALAFNRKAMEEMRERLAQMGIPGVKVFTLHAYGLKIVKHFLKDWKFSEEDKNLNFRNVIISCLKKEYHFQPQRDQDLIVDFIDAVQRIKSTLCHPSEVKLNLDEVDVDFEKLFDSILKKQNEEKIFEFSDMIYLAIRLLFKNPKFRQWLQMQQQYILVDEFQDLNAAQIMMVDILSRPWRNLFVVGDDDQLIYGWRGAETEHILNFNKRFGYFQRYILNYNYRSKRSLIIQTRQLIHYNTNRVNKKILPKNDDISETIKIIAASNIWEEANLIVDKVEKLIKSGVSLGSIALLSRFNAYLFVLSLMLGKKGIKHEIPDPSLLLQTVAGRDFLAYFTLAVFPQKAEAWMVKRALKRPNKYLTNEFINKVRNLEDVAVKGQGQLKIWQWERIAAFLDGFNYLGHLRKGGMSPQNFIKEMIRVFELKFLYEEEISGDVKYDRASDLAVLEIFQLMSKPFKRLEDYYTYLVNLEKSKVVIAKDSVHLTTIHRTKGNEYPVVFIFHLNDPEDISEEEYKLYEEERRVSYVAATRAIERIYISISKSQGMTHLTELMKPGFLNSKKKINLRAIKKEEKQKLKKAIFNLPDNELKNTLNKIAIEMDEIADLKLLHKSFELLTELKNQKILKKYQPLIELLDRQFLLNKYDDFLSLKKEIVKK